MPTVNQADWAHAATQFPVTAHTQDAGFWASFFEERPGVLHQLLGDLYLITKAHQRADRRGGRRSRTINGNMEELWGMLTPRFATEPFGPATRELMGATSLRQFAKKVPMHHHALARLISGERPVVRPKDPEGTMRILEAVAKAGGVHPSYFLEWREVFVYNALQQAFETSPNLSITVTRNLLVALNNV